MTENNSFSYSNVTNAIGNNTIKFEAKPMGILIADLSLLFMAILPIFWGALKSVSYHKKQRESGEPAEYLSHKDAAIFPLTASATLLGLYIFFKGSPKPFENEVNHSTEKDDTQTTSIDNTYNNPKNNTEKPKKETNDLIKVEFDRVDLLTLSTSLIIGIWYLMKKHWIANNIFGLAFATNAIELLQLNRISTGLILLGGLFIYDIFWVFGTNVMVTVAKSFEAPIKLMFPLDFVEKGLSASNFAMLGLGDIVIPGIFIALILRFEMNSLHNPKKKLYFYSTMLAYILGLVFTTLILHFYKHAQPALLYLVPACVGTPFIISLARGEWSHLMKYEDNPATEDKQLNDNQGHQINQDLIIDSSDDKKFN
ncbi:minor histocompatibility antigen H13-like isoform X2 [Gordionus sp. m RMFG-2023]|uniref:minor histocompatibility antigen H13-like isoform X2 n=1 Tax=Gordionus sp. m RMFG-2023 TaxID=3053472 RepID=UPI0031FD926A